MKVDYDLRADKGAVREKTAFGSDDNNLYLHMWTAWIYFSEQYCKYSVLDRQTGIAKVCT